MCTMKSLSFLTMTTIVFQITSISLVHCFFDHWESSTENYNPPTTWPSEDNIPITEKNKPFGTYAAFEISHTDYFDNTRSSEDEQEITRQRPTPPRIPGHGRPILWRPPPPPSPERETPSKPPGPSEPPGNNTQEQISLCIKSCPVTSEFNPVCGSNDVTYSNLGRLDCERECGVVVTLSKQSACGDPKPQALTSKIAMCLRSCSVTSEFNPVCGSDNITYTNPGHLECAINCGVPVSLKRLTSCEAVLTAEEIKTNAIKNERTTTEPNLILTTSTTTISGESKDETDSKGSPGGEGSGGNNNQGGNGGNNEYHLNNNCKGVINNKRTPTLQEVMACMQTCSLTSESNPVCGTDSITYMNPGRLLCAQYCGTDVKVKKFAPCGSTNIINGHCLTTCTNPPVTGIPEPATPPVPSIEACMEACPASFEFNPVCGTNNVTYRNLEKLQCARRCGINVSLKRSIHCAAPEIKPEPKNNATLILECIEQCSVPQKYEPLCGSNDVTYNNIGHLICARQCGLDIQVKQPHACSTVPVSPSPVTTEKLQVVDPGQNNFNFSIDPAILDNIWGTTSKTPKEGDEDFELDHRVQDDQQKSNRQIWQ